MSGVSSGNSVSDAIAAACAAKEKRVVGVFVFMLGAGFVIDRQAFGAGALAMLLGAAVFTWGVLLQRQGAAKAEAPGTQPLERAP